jgi:Icc protein
MLKRRDFLRLLGWGLAGTWAAGRWSWPLPALAGLERQVRLALLADAHLKSGADCAPEARALARAVAEIRRLTPPPDLVLFAGDLAHRADPRALALGKEILSDLPGPLLLVMGEGDGLPDHGAPWRRLFGEPWFSRVFTVNPYPRYLSRQNEAGNLTPNFLPKPENQKPKPVIQILGLDTAWCPGPGGPAFYLGEAGRSRLAEDLARLDSAAPLLVLSHAPLARVFRPWHRWTGDAPEILDLLSRFCCVLLVHGHTHGAVSIFQDFEPKAPTLLGLPATAWPLPSPVLGTPARLRPGLGAHGCGWSLAAFHGGSLEVIPQTWQA